MRKKKIRSFILLSGLALACSSADAQTNIVVNRSDGMLPGEKIPIGNVRKITFGGGMMEIGFLNGDADRSFVLKDIRTITFEDVATSINAADAGENNGLALYYRNGLLGADGSPAKGDATARVYDVSGRLVLNVLHWDGTPIPTAAITDGIYIFKVNDKTLKFKK